jgi:hypothetical protein
MHLGDEVLRGGRQLRHRRVDLVQVAGVQRLERVTDTLHTDGQSSRRGGRRQQPRGDQRHHTDGLAGGSRHLGQRAADRGQHRRLKLADSSEERLFSPTLVETASVMAEVMSERSAFRSTLTVAVPCPAFSSASMRAMSPLARSACTLT